MAYIQTVAQVACTAGDQAGCLLREWLAERFLGTTMRLTVDDRFSLTFSIHAREANRKTISIVEFFLFTTGGRSSQ
jgi:hypothetical protein